MSDISAALRSEVRARAGMRCEYCQIPEILSLVSHEVDHIIAVKHGGSSHLDNLALCCTICNKHKGSDLASIDPSTTGEMVRLYHPRQDRWHDHFEMRDAFLEARTSIGRVTIRLLQFNSPERIKERAITPRVATPPA